VTVHALYFAQLRETLGRSEEDLTLTQGTSLKEVFVQLANREPRLTGFRDSVVFFLNDERAIGSEALQNGDRVAFCPPVSGG
jgi:sulfur-carrier protein